MIKAKAHARSGRYRIVINTERLTKSAWLALLLLGAAYALLGWYLSAHHLFWLVGTAVFAVTFFLVGQPNPLLAVFAELKTPGFLVAIIGVLLVSLGMTWMITQPLVLTLFFLPLLTLLYAHLEMRTADLSQRDVLLALVLIAGLGLGLGEVIDLFVVPSMRY